MSATRTPATPPETEGPTSARETPAAAPPEAPAAGPPRGPRGPRRWVVPALLLVAGLALGTAGLLAVLAARAPATGVRTVVITMHHTHFQPAEVRVDAGTTVRFVLRNTDPIDHEFIVGDEAVHQRHRVGREAHHHGDVPGEVSVPSGTSASTIFRFHHPGKVVYACHLPGHEAYGMVGVVDVR